MPSWIGGTSGPRDAGVDTGAAGHAFSLRRRCPDRRNRYTAAMRKVYRDVAGPCLTPDGSVVCIGAFDGVHRGHREVLDRVRARSEELRATPVAVTFAPLPRVYFGQSVAQLTTV